MRFFKLVNFINSFFMCGIHTAVNKVLTTFQAQRTYVFTIPFCKRVNVVIFVRASEDKSSGPSINNKTTGYHFDKYVFVKHLSPHFDKRMIRDYSKNGGLVVF